MKKLFFTLALISVVLPIPIWVVTSQGRPKPPAVQRPPIIGVAHIGLKTDDLKAAREFYGHELGYEEAFTLDKPGGGVMMTCFKVNDHQYFEIFPELKSPTEDRLSHIAFETTDIQKLRDYLASRGVKVPDKPDVQSDGNHGFEVTDPDGHAVEFVQYMPGSLHSKNFGKFLPASRISERIIHVGVTVQDQDAANRFYRDILGFKKFWHGGMKDDRTDWVDMRVPEGTDWLEYMLNVHNPTPKTLGVMHHAALGVPSVAEGYKTALDRGFKPDPPKIGRDGKWQLNLYDPNLTRVELMEPQPVETPCCSPMLDLHSNSSIGSVQILSDTKGADFGPYLSRVVYNVKQNWYSVIPSTPQRGEQGKLTLVLEIIKDGSAPQVRLVGSSGSEPLDRAAVFAIKMSNPFPSLPDQFTGNHLVLQFIFLYNLGTGP